MYPSRSSWPRDRKSRTTSWRFCSMSRRRTLIPIQAAAVSRSFSTRSFMRAQTDGIYAWCWSYWAPAYPGSQRNRKTTASRQILPVTSPAASSKQWPISIVVAWYMEVRSACARSSCCYLTRLALDIHMGNILMRLPPGVGPELLSSLASPQIGKVSRKDGSPLEKGVPEYLVEPLEYDVKAFDLDRGDVQLVDFGSGVSLASSYYFCRGANDGTSHSLLCLEPTKDARHTPLTISSRAGLQASPYTGGRHLEPWVHGRRVAAAATSKLLTSTQVYHLVTGRTPFEAGFDSKELIPQYGQVLGGVPTEWVREALANGVLDEEPDSLFSPTWRTMHIVLTLQRGPSRRFSSARRRDSEGLRRPLP